MSVRPSFLGLQRRVSHFHFYENLVAANLGKRFAL